MISVKAENLSLQTDMNTGDMFLRVSIIPAHRKAVQAVYQDLRNKPLRIDLKEWRDKRSLDANAFLWTILDKIADVNSTTKEEVYQHLVRDVGVFEYILVINEAKDTFMRRWGARGLGWFAEEMPGSKVDGCTRVIAYYGSSTYDTKEMSRIIDQAVQLAESLDIPTLPDGDIKKLKDGWKAS